MAIESKTYDCIIPLGSGCAVANQLKLRGLRKYSLPFDWVAIIDDEWLLQSVESIETHF